MTENSFHLAGLTCVIVDYERPGATEYWDANWLVVIASYESPMSSVTNYQSSVFTYEIREFLCELNALIENLEGAAFLQPVEKGFEVSIVAKNRLGHMEARIAISRNHEEEEHIYKTEIDQTDVQKLASELRALLHRFPVRGEVPTDPSETNFWHYLRNLFGFKR